jgi:succinate dehydrogenase / fumarate reductase, membrane anchor subunit
MVNRTVVGAHYGLKDWLAQRVTAAVMAVYTLMIGVVWLAGGPFSYNTWKSLFSQGWMRFATLLFVLSMLYHAWVGVRDICMDYVKNTGLRLLLEVATVLWLVGCGGWAVQVIWRS